MANPFLYIVTTKNAWNSKVPNFMLAAWGYDEVTIDPETGEEISRVTIEPTWKQAMTHVFANGYSVAGPRRWKEGSEADGTQVIFKMMWLPDVETFLKPLIDFIVANPTKARIMGHDETRRWLTNQGWDAEVGDL